MNKISNNNIFKYATKELSQDAFIAWIVSFAQKSSEEYESDREKHYWNKAQILLNLFVSGCIPDKESNKKEYKVTDEVQLQKNKIDVFIQLEEKYTKEKYVVIVEDKVNSKMHDNQINRYIDEVKEDFSDCNIRVVYYKTGIITDLEDLELKKISKEQKVDIFKITTTEMLKILEPADKTEQYEAYDLLNMYTGYINFIHNRREEVNAIVKSDNKIFSDYDSIYGDGINILSTEEGQWEFFSNVFDFRNPKVEENNELKEEFDKWRNKNPDFNDFSTLYIDYMDNGSSSGSPYMQYAFWEDIFNEDDNEKANTKKPPIQWIMWRLEENKVSLRCYINCGSSRDKSDFLSKVKGICDEISKELKQDGNYKNWKIKTNHAIYEFAMLERKFNDTDTFKDITSEIRYVHEQFLIQFSPQRELVRDSGLR